MTNYFELYGLPPSFHPGAAAVKAKYRELSRLHHPDRHAGATPARQEEVLRLSAAINEGYKTLLDADRTMAYILRLHGTLGEEEKHTLPPAFLMEMMDLNEAVSDYEGSPKAEGKDKAMSDLAAALSGWQAAVAPLLQRFDAGEHDAALLQQVADYYFRKKYLLRIQERLNTFAAAQ